MANVVYIKVKEERDLELCDGKFKPTSGTAEKTAYICCDGLTCWVGQFKTLKGFMKLVGPENLINTIEENLSDIEQEEIMSVLKYRDYRYKLNYLDRQLLVAEKSEE